MERMHNAVWASVSPHLSGPRRPPLPPLCRGLIGRVRIKHCQLYETSFIATRLPPIPCHIHSSFEFSVTPKQAIVWANGNEWVTFRKNRKGEYWSPMHGFLEIETVGVAWGRPVVLGARRSVLMLPRNHREEIKELLRQFRTPPGSSRA